MLIHLFGQPHRSRLKILITSRFQQIIFGLNRKKTKFIKHNTGCRLANFSLSTIMNQAKLVSFEIATKNKC